jgi:phage tail protein X
MSYVIAKTIQSQDGDWWDTISKREYGTEKFFNVLAGANPSLALYAQLPAGLTVSIPFIKVQIPSRASGWSILTK